MCDKERRGADREGERERRVTTGYEPFEREGARRRTRGAERCMAGRRKVPPGYETSPGHEGGGGSSVAVGGVDIRLPGKGNANSHGARPVC